MKKEMKNAAHVAVNDDLTPEQIQEVLDFGKHQNVPIIFTNNREGRTSVLVDLFREQDENNGIRVPKSKRAKIITRRFSENNTRLFLLIGSKRNNELTEMHPLPRVEDVGIQSVLKAWSIMSPADNKISSIARISSRTDKVIDAIFKQPKITNEGYDKMAKHSREAEEYEIALQNQRELLSRSGK